MNFMKAVLPVLLLYILFPCQPLAGQETVHKKMVIQTSETFQTVTGFGASLAYYENWVNAHPKKNEIYEAIFGEIDRMAM